MLVHPAALYTTLTRDALLHVCACTFHSKGVSETHPWHLHGHDFWIVGTYAGQYNGTLPDDGGGQYVRDVVNLVGGTTENHIQPDFAVGAGDEARRTEVCDTAYNGGSSFSVIRFVADNPGTSQCCVDSSFYVYLVTLHETSRGQNLDFT